MSTAANFDRLARVYRWMEALTFGPMLMRVRCAMLSQMRSCSRALVLGDGDGRFAVRLLRSNPAVLIDAVDASAAMLAELRRNAGRHAQCIHINVADVREWQPAREDYDLIVTHFFLDCLTSDEVHVLAAQLREACVPGAVWVVSEFAIPHGLFGAAIAQPLIALLYRAFGLLTGLQVRRLPDHRVALADAGFVLANAQPVLLGLLVSELWQAQSH